VLQTDVVTRKDSVLAPALSTLSFWSVATSHQRLQLADGKSPFGSKVPSFFAVPSAFASLTAFSALR
jgi:hypothetical protein